MAERISPQVEALLHNKQNVEQVVLSPELFPIELLSVAEQLGGITGTWNPIELVDASKESLATAKSNVYQAYLEGREYNPIFTYPNIESFDVNPNVSTDLNNLLQRVRQFQPSSTFEKIAKIALNYKIKDDLGTLFIISGIRKGDEQLIKRAFSLKYLGSDAFLLQAANDRYSQMCVGGSESQPFVNPLLNAEQQKLLKQTKVTPEQVKYAFEWVLSEYGILRTPEHPEGFQVIISPDVVSIDVRDKSKNPLTIYIPTDLRGETADKLLEWVIHEIEGHARQSMNGKKLFKIGGGILKIDDETLYEGLAKRLDESYRLRFFGTNTGMPLPYYAFAHAMAEQGANFSQIFKDQVDRQLHVDLKIDPVKQIPFNSSEVKEVMQKAMDKAWRTTYRIMRGHVNTQNKEKYGLPKDLAYLRGWLIDRELRGSGLDYLNETAIIQTNALPLLGRIRFEPQDLPIPYRDLTKKFCFDVLLPLLGSQKDIQQ